jgi:hypothetical protein
MNRYGFYSKHDFDKEIIYSQKFQTLEQALEFFAKMKALSTEEFLKLYQVTYIQATNEYHN